MSAAQSEPEDFRVLQTYEEIRALIEEEVFDALGEEGYKDWAREIANKVANNVCQHLDAA
jgi:hypothetical protein